MFLSHMYRIFKSNLSKSIFLFILLIPTLEIIQIFLQTSSVPRPNFAFFLAGISRGHIFQIILLWFLPLYFLLIISEDSIEDYKTGYSNILISKIGKKAYYKEKIMSSFLISFITMFIALIINLLLVNLIFYRGTYYPQEGVILENNLLFTFSMKYPLITNFIFIIIASILAGFSGVIGASFSLFFKDKKYAYATTFFVWFVLVIKKNSLMYLFQPFAEYDVDVLLPILIASILLFILISVSVYIYEVYFSEN